MIVKIKTIFLALFCSTILTSCLIEEPKKKTESVSSSEQYEKVIDDLIGEGSINPEAIQIGDADTMVQTLTVSNSLAREQFRRRLKVMNVEYNPNTKQRKYTFEVRIIERDSAGNIQDEITKVRELVLAVTPEGYYQFMGESTDQTLFSWDRILSLRGFCHSFQGTDNDGYHYDVQITCSNIKVEAETWGSMNLPVRKLSLNRQMIVKNLDTGKVDEGKIHFTVRIAPGVQEISKIVSFCSEGMQKFNNQIYYLINCNNIESL